jgi:hypothetical protein
MKTLFLILGIVGLFFTANAKAEDCEDQSCDLTYQECSNPADQCAEVCPDEDEDFSLPGLTAYQSKYVYRGEACNGCTCPVLSDGGTYYFSSCRTGGSIDTPG